MSFINFLLFQEFSDLSKLSTGEIEFKKSFNKIIYSFSLGDNLYEIYFKPNEMEISDKNFNYITIFRPYDDCYSIGLTINNNYNQSHQGNAFAVYTKLFAAIKKFIEEYDPKGLIFYGYESSMDILYKRFYEKYLSHTFMQIDRRNYIKKSYFSSMPQSMQDFINQYMHGFDFSSEIKMAKQEKIDLMKQRALIRQKIKKANELFKIGDKVKILSHYKYAGDEGFVQQIDGNGDLTIRIDEEFPDYITVDISDVEKI